MMNCNFEVNEFELQLGYHLYFRTNTLEKSMDPLIISDMGWIAPLLFFYTYDFNIK